MKKLFFVLVFVTGCWSIPYSQCENPGTMRCNGNVVEVCVAGKQWVPGENCSEAVMFSGEPAPMTCVDDRGLVHCE
jgi:hypothetical protein